MIDEWISCFDMECFAFFGKIQSAFLTAAAEIFSLDNSIVLAAGGVLLVILCIKRKTRKIGFAIVFAVLLGYLITDGIIKPAVCRVRPSVALQDHVLFMEWFRNIEQQTTSQFSFPSGHTTVFSAVTTVLMLFHASSDRKPAKAVMWIFPLLAFLSGCSRIYLMVHYATDVIAGFLVGAATGIGGYLLITRVIFHNDRTTP